MLVIAHRGSNRDASENSMEAFELAILQGATRIEFDLQLTKDQKFIVHHDASVKLPDGSRLHFEKVLSKDLTQLRVATKMPLVHAEDVVSAFSSRCSLNLEIKGTSELCGRLALELTKNVEDRSNLIFSSFHPNPLIEIRSSDPLAKIACLWGYDQLNRAEFSLFAPQIFMNQCGAKIIHPQAELIDENFMDQAFNKCWQVFSWSPMRSIEDQDPIGLWNHLQTLGVHGHCTNYPRKMARWKLMTEADLGRVFVEAETAGDSVTRA